MKNGMKIWGVVALPAITGRHGGRCKKALAGVFAKQILLWPIVAGMLLLTAGCEQPDGGGPGHSHDFSGDWHKNAAQHWKVCPTDNAEGQKSNHAWTGDVCDVCKYDRSVPHSHDYGEDWESDEDGHWHECDCGDKIDVEEHDWYWALTTPATTEAAGLETETCKVCDRESGETKIIDKIPPNHSHEYVWKSNATHHWEECESGDDTKGEADHVWGGWTPIDEATCTEKGRRERECTVCHFADPNTDIPIVDDAHDWKDVWTIIDEPECEKAGEEEDTCNNDTNHKRQRPVTAIGHEWKDEWNVTIHAECEEAGEEEDTCNNDTNHKRQRPIPAIGHEWEWRETKSATFTTDGEETEICSHNTTHAKDTRPVLAGNKSIAGITAYLATQPANTADEPIPLPVNIDLGNMTDSDSGWLQLLGVLNAAANKYVDLDLSLCEMDGTVFKPVGTVYTSKDTIVAITLPTAGITIQAGTFLVSAFAGFTSLASFTIPDGYTAIPDYAFYNCTSLTSVDIPGSVKSIGVLAFQNCTGLTGVDIPGSVTSISRNAFVQCTGLTGITVDPNNLTYASWDGIVYNKAQTEIVLAPPGLSGSVTIPDGVESIGELAFSGCRSLTGVTIPGSVKSIGVLAFQNCTGLTGVDIGNGVESIDQAAFYGCSGLTSVTIPDSVQTIGSDFRDGSFEGCTGLTSVTIGNGVTTIRSNTFKNCNNLTSVTFRRANTTIFATGFPNGASLQTAYTGIGTYTRDNSTVPIPDSVPWVKQL